MNYKQKLEQSYWRLVEANEDEIVRQHASSILDLSDEIANEILSSNPDLRILLKMEEDFENLRVIEEETSETESEEPEEILT